MIPPTIGRVVLVHVPGNSQWMPAQISYVHGGELINVGGFDNRGEHFAFTSIRLVQDPIAEDAVFVPIGLTEVFACWMPYQRQAQVRETERAAQVPSQR